MSTALAPLTGTLPERHQAFSQIAAAMAQAAEIAPNGYNTTGKAMLACWAADALGVHPVTYMQNVWIMDIKGKKKLEPQREFLSGLLRARLPGFDFTVHEETAEACDIEFFAKDRKAQRVRYTIEDAERQQLAGKDAWVNNTREMLYKQAFRRGAQRIGADVLMGLPPLDQDGGETVTHEPSTVTVLDDAPAGGERPHVREARQTAAVAAPVREALDAAAAVAPEDWNKKLGKTLLAAFGKRPIGVMRQLSAKLYWMATGAEASFTAAGSIGPMEAQVIVEYMGKLSPEKLKAIGGGDATEATDTAVGVTDDTTATEHGSMSDAAISDAEKREALMNEPAAEEVAPSLPLGDDPVPPPADFAPPGSLGMTWDEFLMNHVEKSRKVLGKGRPIIREDPPQSGTWWVTDGELLKELGAPNSLLGLKNGAQKMTADELERVASVLATLCARAESAKAGR